MFKHVQDILFPLLDKLLIDILNDALSTYGRVILTVLIITMLTTLIITTIFIIFLLSCSIADLVANGSCFQQRLQQVSRVIIFH